MRVKIEFDVDNAAFEDEQEIDRVMLVCANKIRTALYSEAGIYESYRRLEVLFDSNGNRIGQVEVLE